MSGKPITYQRDLANLPRALARLTKRRQWAIWKWEQNGKGIWQKPPYMATRPDRHASTTDPSTWSSYETAVAAWEAGHGDGISYILTENDPHAAIDIDHCRCLVTRSIDTWAQNFLDCGRHSYSEITPSGTGCRIWGLAQGNKLDRKFTLLIDDKLIGAELFRRTNKALTITGNTLDPYIHELANIDRVLSWAIVWGERRKAAETSTRKSAGNGFDHDGCGYSLDQIDQFVRQSPPPVNGQSVRSEIFHTVVGHYIGIGWTPEQIHELMEQFPDGVGGRYLAQGRLLKQIIYSAEKFGWQEPAPELPLDEPKDEIEPDETDPDDDMDDDVDGDLDDDEPPPVPEPEPWPVMGEAAYHGLAGDVVRTIEPHSEADPNALLLQFLEAVGNAIGRGPYYMVEGDYHYTKLYLVLIGDTGEGRKGTSLGRVMQVMEQADPEWVQYRVQSGLVSGEGLIHHVRDPQFKLKDGEMVEVDRGVPDKRLLIDAQEFASVLSVMEKPGNTLSPVIRDAWGHRPLQTLGKVSPDKATGSHICINAHITEPELPGSSHARRWPTASPTGSCSAGYVDRRSCRTAAISPRRRSSAWATASK
jgi:hypothetical protein